MSQDEATIIMVDSNIQREKVLPSTKGKAYKMKLDAMRRSAGRPSKENCVPVGHDSDGRRSREILADNSPDSNTQIQRYIRLTELIVNVKQNFRQTI
jgi:ParB family chromosome partitioning protein